MCLACEMDALWFAEMETAARATLGSAGVPPALKNYSASLPLGSSERASETPAVPGVPPAASHELRGVECELSKSTGGTPALQASPFRCEETRSE